mgnify:FL=1
MTAMSWGNIYLPWNRFSSVNWCLLVELSDGSGIIYTFLVDRLRPTIIPISPCNTLSNPPTSALLKPDMLPMYLTLLSMVLVLTSHIPKLVKI